LVCFALLPFTLLMMGMIAIAIMLDSRGSPFFVQERIGFRGQRFRVYKFRTMWSDHDDRRDREFMQLYVAGKLDDQTDNEDKLATFKPIRKEDITRIGRLLRKTSLDELPQIFNVIRGEMSLIGPRPNVPWEVEAYKAWHRERLCVLPGITGLAQVMGRSDISFDQIARFDIQYAKNQTIQLDFWIMWQTFKIVIVGKGAG
jgi:lipopolysaccharide/colanic/teichoic acid biosynthesis glycosyltransferase